MNGTFRVITKAARSAAAAAAPASLALLLLPSCARVQVEHKVEPIHVVHDINIRVDRELDEFFASQNQGGAAATQSTTAQTASNAQGVKP
jgi:hypothetical protein